MWHLFIQLIGKGIQLNTARRLEFSHGEVVRKRFTV